MTFTDLDPKVTKICKVLADPKGHHYSKYELNRPGGYRVSRFNLHCDLYLDLNVTKLCKVLADLNGYQYSKYELNHPIGC